MPENITELDSNNFESFISTKDITLLVDFKCHGVVRVKL